MDLFTVTLAMPVVGPNELIGVSREQMLLILQSYFGRAAKGYQIAEVHLIKDADGDEPTAKLLAREFITRPLREIPIDETPDVRPNRGSNPRVRCDSPVDKCGWDGLVDEGEPLDEHMRTQTLEADHGQKPRCRCPQCGNLCYLDVARQDRRRIVVVVDQYGQSTQTVYADAPDVDVELVVLDSDTDVMVDEPRIVLGQVVDGYGEPQTFHDHFIVEHHGGSTPLPRVDRVAVMRASAVRTAISKGFRDAPAPQPPPYDVPGKPRYVYADRWEHLDEENKPYLLRWVYDRKAHDLTDTAELIADEGVKTQRTQEIVHGSEWWKDVWDHLTNANPEILNGSGDPADFGVVECDADGLPEWAREAKEGSANAHPPAA
jgi:hypothetical protein